MTTLQLIRTRSCATPPQRPGTSCPANRKWYRNLAVCEATVDALAARRDEWNDALRVLGKAKLAELRALRTPGKSAK